MKVTNRERKLSETKCDFDYKIMSEFKSFLVRLCKKPIFKFKSHLSKINKNNSMFSSKIKFLFFRTYTLKTKKMFFT